MKAGCMICLGMGGRKKLDIARYLTEAQATASTRSIHVRTEGIMERSAVPRGPSQ